MVHKLTSTDFELSGRGIYGILQFKINSISGGLWTSHSGDDALESAIDFYLSELIKPYICQYLSETRSH